MELPMAFGGENNQRKRISYAAISVSKYILKQEVNQYHATTRHTLKKDSESINLFIINNDQRNQLFNLCVCVWYVLMFICIFTCVGPCVSVCACTCACSCACTQVNMPGEAEANAGVSIFLDHFPPYTLNSHLNSQLPGSATLASHIVPGIPISPFLEM